jgi:hypothetical protein
MPQNEYIERWTKQYVLTTMSWCYNWLIFLPSHTY